MHDEVAAVADRATGPVRRVRRPVKSSVPAAWHEIGTSSHATIHQVRRHDLVDDHRTVAPDGRRDLGGTAWLGRREMGTAYPPQRPTGRQHLSRPGGVHLEAQLGQLAQGLAHILPDHGPSAGMRLGQIAPDHVRLLVPSQRSQTAAALMLSRIRSWPTSS